MFRPFFSQVLICIGLAFSLPLLAAQQATTPAQANYLITLNRPTPGFEAKLRAAGATPVQHAGALWLVSMEDSRKAEVQQMPEVQGVTPAIPVILELESTARDISTDIEALGGMVTRRYQNIPATAAAVPLSQLDRLRDLPGVKKVRRQKTVPLVTVH